MRTKTRALSVFAGTTAGLIFLAGCSAGPAEPETQAPTAEVQEDKVRLLSAEEVAERAKKDAESSGRAYTGPKTTGLQAILVRGECELSFGLAFSGQDVGTRAEGHSSSEVRDRAAVTFNGKASRGTCPEDVSRFLKGMKVVDASGEQISEYKDIYLHSETSELGKWHQGEPVIGAKGGFLAGMEIQADKFSPDMKLVLETPDGDFTVEAQDWMKPSERHADAPLIEDGACLAGEKL